MKQITYEHYLVEKFYKDIYMETAERNYFVDEYHEIGLCVYYNRRIKGKYEFIPQYQFFVANERCGLKVYWNLGNIPDESIILEKYDSLEESKKSEYYKDFCEMKKQIDKRINQSKKIKLTPLNLNI